MNNLDVLEIERLTGPIDHEKAPLLQEAARHVAHIRRAQIDSNRPNRLDYARLHTLVHVAGN